MDEKKIEKMDERLEKKLKKEKDKRKMLEARKKMLVNIKNEEMKKKKNRFKLDKYRDAMWYKKRMSTFIGTLGGIYLLSLIWFILSIVIAVVVLLINFNKIDTLYINKDLRKRQKIIVVKNTLILWAIIGLAIPSILIGISSAVLAPKIYNSRSMYIENMRLIKSIK